MRKVKLVALDIDGVLNSVRHTKETGGMSNHHFDLDPAPVKLLRELIDETSTDDVPTCILLTSTWRLDFATSEGVNCFFEAAGIPHCCIGRTEHFGCDRGLEILLWIAQEQVLAHFEVDSLVILDDDSDMGPLSEYLVRTSNKNGFTLNEMMAAKSMLNEEKFQFQLNLGSS